MLPLLFLHRVLGSHSKAHRAILVASAFGVLLTFSFTRAVLAHPLGNFTINHYARLDIEPTQLQLYFVLDLAEIPAFQEKQTMDANSDGTTSNDERARYLASQIEILKSNLGLEINGSPAPLKLVPDSAKLEFLPGQGGLEIMRVSAQFTTPLDLNSANVTIAYRDATYPERIGWREIVARAGDGVTLIKSNVRATETSDELRKYPQDLLSNPLNDREANLIVGRGNGNATATGGNIGGGSTWIVIVVVAAVILAALGGMALILRSNPRAPR